MTHNTGPVAAGTERREPIRDLVRHAQGGGLPSVAQCLHRFLGVEVGIFDLDGNILAASPNRTLWDYDQLLRAREGHDNRLAVRTVLHHDETIALLATGATTDGRELLDVAESVIAMEIARLRARQEGRRELAATVLDDIIANRLSEQDSLNALRRIGIDGNRPMRVLLGWCRRSAPRRGSVPWNLHALMSDRPDPLVRVDLGENVLMVIPDDTMADRIARTLHQHLADQGAEATVGVSLPHTGSNGLRAGYYEAMSALREGRGVHYPAHVDLARILVLTLGAPALDEIARRVLGPLLDYDSTRGGALVPTLREYLACNRMATETAERLFIHRNTLRYRLRQISELLDIDIDSTWATTNLWLALTVLGEVSDR